MERVTKPYAIADTRDMRFGEILVVKATGIDIYNTSGVSDCPQDLWDAMDLEAVRRQFDALKIQKNGPHYWMMDSQTVLFGEEAQFGGIKARWGATVDPAALASVGKGPDPYKVFMPKKTQKMVYAKGKPVYELVDPDGNVYALQAHDQQFPIDSLDRLGEKLKLPERWQFRIQIPDEDLILDLRADQTIYGVGDEFHQYWMRIPGAK